MSKFAGFSGVILVVAALATVSSAAEEQKVIKPALIVIDIQNEFLPYVPEREQKLALEMINGAISLFRQHGFPVIRVYHTDPQWGPAPDSHGFQFPESVNISEDDLKIIKNYSNAFKNTDLHQVLLELKCNTLFLCGLSAVGCVLATYFAGQDLDYNVFLIRNALMSHESRYTAIVQEAFDSVSWQALKLMLDSASREK